MITAAAIAIIVVCSVVLMAATGGYFFRRWWVKRRNHILEENHNAARELAEAGEPHGPRIMDDFSDIESLKGGKYGRDASMSFDSNRSRAQSPSGRSQYSFVLDAPPPKRPESPFRRSFSPSRLKESMSSDRKPEQTADEFQEAAREQLRRKARENLSMYESLSRPGSRVNSRPASPDSIANGRSASPAVSTMSLASVDGSNVPSKWILPTSSEVKYLDSNPRPPPPVTKSRHSARNSPKGSARNSARNSPRASPRPSMHLNLRPTASSLSLDNAPRNPSRLRLQPSYAELNGRKSHDVLVDMKATMPPSPSHPPRSSDESSADSRDARSSGRSVSKERSRSRSRSRGRSQSRGRRRSKSQPPLPDQLLHEGRAHTLYASSQAPQLPVLSPLRYSFLGGLDMPKEDTVKSPFDDPVSEESECLEANFARRSPSPTAPANAYTKPSRDYELDTPVAPYVYTQSNNGFGNAFSDSTASEKPLPPIASEGSRATAMTVESEKHIPSGAQVRVLQASPASPLLSLQTTYRAIVSPPLGPTVSGTVRSVGGLLSVESVGDGLMMKTSVESAGDGLIPIPSPTNSTLSDPPTELTVHDTDEPRDGEVNPDSSLATSSVQSFRFPDVPERAHRPAPLDVRLQTPKANTLSSTQTPSSASTTNETPLSVFSFEHTPNKSASTMSSFDSATLPSPKQSTTSAGDGGYFDNYLEEFTFNFAQEARSPKIAPRISFVRSSVGSVQSMQPPETEVPAMPTHTHRKTNTLSRIREAARTSDDLTDEQWKDILDVPSPLSAEGLGRSIAGER